MMRKMLRKLGLVLVICLLLLSACTNVNGMNVDVEEKQEKYYFSEMESKIAQSEILKESGNIGWCHEVAYVSPYASDEELKELAKIISEVSRDKDLDLSYATVYVNCYSAQILQAELKEKPDEKTLYQTLREGVAAQKGKADMDLAAFHARLSSMSYLYQSESGEYYFVVRGESFDVDCQHIVNTLLEINKINPLGKYGIEKVSYTYYFSETGNVYVGFTGDRFAVYQESYAPENRIYEEKFITNGLAMDAIYRAMIFDFGQEKPAQKEGGDIACSSYVYQWDGVPFRLELSWNERSECLSMDELTDYTYALYEKMKNAMREKNCEDLTKLRILATAPFGSYNVERDYVNCELSFLKEYTKEEWKEKLQEGFERRFEMEPQ